MSHDSDVKFCECGKSLWDGATCNCKELKMKAQQIGGDHYVADYQHWDWAMDVRLGYFESAASKYVFRWYKKNGVEDLDKARSYLLKAKEGFLEGRWSNKCLHVDSWPLARDKAEAMFAAFCDEATVPMVEADICLAIAQWRNDVDLSIIIGKLGAHIEAVQAQVDAGGNLGPLHLLTAPQAAKTGGSGQASGTTTQGAPSSTSVELAMKSFGLCPCGCGRPRAKGQNYATLDCAKNIRSEELGKGINHPSPFGYEREME